MAETTETIEVELVTPEELVFSEEATMVVVPGAEGDFGVLPKHAPLISNLRPGIIHITTPGGSGHNIFVAEGFAEVTSSRCTILAQEAIDIDKTTRKDIEERHKQARKNLESASTDKEKDLAQQEINFTASLLELL